MQMNLKSRFGGKDPASYQEFAEAGVACPEDISVTGCGDLPLAGSMTPSLTTIKLPQYHVGVQVAQLLLDRIANPSSPPVAQRKRRGCRWSRYLPTM